MGHTRGRTGTIREAAGSGATLHALLAKAIDAASAAKGAFKNAYCELQHAVLYSVRCDLILDLHCIFIHFVRFYRLLRTPGRKKIMLRCRRPDKDNDVSLNPHRVSIIFAELNGGGRALYMDRSSVATLM